MKLPQRFDWSARRFLPVEIEVRDNVVLLKANGETAVLEGSLFRLEAKGPLKSKWKITGREFKTLSLSLTALANTVLEEVCWFAGKWKAGLERAVSRTAVQDNVLFLRKNGVSFFLSLDFPYSRITEHGISYPPHERLRAGKIHHCHSLSVGACKLSGLAVGQFDRAEIEAVSEYVETRHPPRFERPVFLSTCITNRLTECANGRIFYSMRDNPTLALNPALLEEDLRLLHEIGVEYFQVFEGVFDWPDAKTGVARRRLGRLAQSLGMRLGGYAVPQGVHCKHYNYSHRRTDDKYRVQLQDGTYFYKPCLACREYVDSFFPRLLAHARKYHEELICLDFLALRPCHARDHDHPPGDLYRQILALSDICRELNALSPNYLIWPNAGDWLELMPKFTWFTPNVYLTDPHYRSYSPTLSMHKLMGDTRREQMVSIHDHYFVPWRNFTNCEYYAFPRSRIPDEKVFEYSFLQGLAVTPNIAPVETRVFLDRIPAMHREKFIAFMRKWMGFIRKNFPVWKQTFRAGEAPGPGAAEIYAHVRKNRGFICLVNQNPFPREARFSLDGTIGLSREKETRFLLDEIYPRICPAAEQPLPFAVYGDTIRCVMPAHSVRFLKLTPGVDKKKIRVHGLPANVTSRSGGYGITLRAPQGEVVSLGVVLPEGSGIRSVSARQTPGVPMYTFPASATIDRRRGNLARISVKFPREKAPRELVHWKVSPGNVPVELPQIGHTPFLGGLLTGCFSEELEVQLTVQTHSVARGGSRLLPGIPKAKPVRRVPFSKKQTFTARFHLPYIEHPAFGMTPAYNDDTILGLSFTDPGLVQKIDARCNGRPLEVRRYVYPRAKQHRWHSFYVELTGQVEAGEITLEIDIEWARKPASKP